MIRLYYTTLCFILLIQGLNAQDYKGVEALAQRVAPWTKGKIIFHALPASGNEKFELSVNNNKLHISANSASAAAMGFNYYLNRYCHQSISHGADNIVPLSKLPEIANPVSVETPFNYRFALNYCTFSYTMAFYDWKDWEKELDWMALQGVNLMYSMVGNEIIWQKTLQKIGFTDAEIKSFIATPAFSAWWLMGNLEGWGGPMTDNMINKQMQLQTKILSRMKELGIEPVLHGFYGMVPTLLKSKFPDAKIFQQGKWVGNFTRPDILSPQDKLFGEISETYYTTIKEVYGREFKYFGGDPFHEGGSTNGIDVTLSAKNIQATMQSNFPGSTWVLQGWGGNPRKELLDGLNKANALVLNLFGENEFDWNEKDYLHWKLTNAYYQTPWIWCSIGNFGEKHGLYGKLDRIINEPHRAAATPEGSFMKGIGIMPEGIANNPLLYDIALKTAWEKKPNTDSLLKEYGKYRYGKEDNDLYKGLLLLKESAYKTHVKYQEGCTESLFAARPSKEIRSVSSWGTRKLFYDNNVLEQALKSFLQASDKFKTSSTYQYDVTDIARQVLANRGQMAFDSLMKAFNHKNKPVYEQYKNKFLALMNLQEQLLATNSNFLLGSWLQQAKKTGTTPFEKQLAEKNARMQITIWGPDTNPATDLHEYAHKEWAGLIRDLYIPRWKLFFAQLDNELAGGAAKSIDFFSMELRWCNQVNNYTTIPKGNYISTIKQLVEAKDFLITGQ